MIKASLIREIGGFNEELASSPDVLLDYELKLLQNGYLNPLCKSAYICDLLPEAPAAAIDRDAMYRLWHMNYFNLVGNHNLVNLIDRNTSDSFHVLEIGCDLGATLLEIKNRFPNSHIHGLELNPDTVKIAEHIADIKTGNIEEYNIPFAEKFDYIIFGDVLEHLRAPAQAVNYCRDRLAADGCIIASIPNLMHISVMQQLVNGLFQYEDTGLLDSTHIHFFTYYQIKQMFMDTHFKLEVLQPVILPVTERQKDLEQRLLTLSAHTEPFMYEAFQYLIRARK